MVVHRNSRKREYKITLRSVGQIILYCLKNVRDLALDPARFQINTPNKPKVTKINALFISPSKFHIEEIKLSI